MEAPEKTTYDEDPFSHITDDESVKFHHIDMLLMDYYLIAEEGFTFSERELILFTNLMRLTLMRGIKLAQTHSLEDQRSALLIFEMKDRQIESCEQVPGGRVLFHHQFQSSGISASPLAISSRTIFTCTRRNWARSKHSSCRSAKSFVRCSIVQRRQSTLTTLNKELNKPI